MPGTAIGTTTDGTPTDGANPWIDGLTWGGRWIDDPAAPTPDGATTITYATVSGADPFTTGFSGAAWGSPAAAALQAGFTAWSNVANVKFVKSASNSTAAANEVDIWAWQLSSADIGGFLGYAEVPGTAGTFDPLYLQFNRQEPTWAAAGWAKGGGGFTTIVHEIGHVLGLAHPHDGGGEADATLFPGVTAEFDSYGDFNLNQGIFTTMSYNDGWAASLPPAANGTYGSQAGPMALDIAAVQAIYGANTNFNNTATTYTLPKVNAAGTFWSCIWDTGGVDTLTNAGSTIGATIDLRAATLVGQNAGGYISYNSGIAGGFTIANGVVIENATGGSGADTLIGNSASNILDGGAGIDNTSYAANAAGVNIQLLSGVAIEGAGVSDTLISIENATGSDFNDSLDGNAVANILDGLAGDDFLHGGAGSDTLLGGAGNDRIVYDAADLAANVTGGADTDTLVVVGGSLPIGFNLVASAFEQAEWQEVDNAGQSWATRVSRFNSDWQITSSSTILDDGVDRELAYDYTTDIVWKSRQLDYAADGFLTYDNLVFDNLGSRYTYFDKDPATSFKLAQSDYDAAGFRTYVYYVFDGTLGSSETGYDNTTDIVWKSQRNDYNAAGEKTYTYYVFDDKSERDIAFTHNVNDQVWLSLMNNYSYVQATDTVKLSDQFYVFHNGTLNHTSDDTSRFVVHGTFAGGTTQHIINYADAAGTIYVNDFYV
jgi:serralysin